MKFAVISDIHEDIVNLEKSFRMIDKANCDKIVCLGDIVGFAKEYYKFKDTKDANKCVNIIKQNCDIVVTGNHDLHAIKKMPSYFKQHNYPDNWFDLEFEERAEISNYKAWFYKTEIDCNLVDENINYLMNLPEFYLEKTPNLNILFSHFIFPDITGSTNFFPSKKRHFIEHFDFMKSHNTSLSIVGHGHVQGFARVNENKRAFFNGFGNGILKNINQIIFTSSIANSSRKSGLLIIDDSKMEFEVIELV
ncbi:MAG: metallophosphoesterase family protein [Bacteroidales bacterium]|nr:metallophosphoesterase family protein [Bacteroidales bacterium]MBN2757321.1 metallophosphoesterase family protein [Bacteroidales bacterium]